MNYWTMRFKSPENTATLGRDNEGAKVRFHHKPRIERLMFGNKPVWETFQFSIIEGEDLMGEHSNHLELINWHGDVIVERWNIEPTTGIGTDYHSNSLKNLPIRNASVEFLPVEEEHEEDKPKPYPPIQAIRVIKHSDCGRIVMGRKRTMILNGLKGYRPGMAVMCNPEIGWTVWAEITEVRHMKAVELTQDELLADHFFNHKDMCDHMQKIYRSFDLYNSDVTVISWKNVTGKIVDDYRDLYESSVLATSCGE